MSHLIIGDNAVDPFIFREYIGVKPYPASLNNFPYEIIIAKHFHFILGFANDSYNEEGKGTGNFNANWNSDFFGPQNVMALKRKYPHVKVVISIGGRDANFPFFPAAREEWCGNAVDSLKEIIRSYNDCSVEDNILIDGIDIFYDYINTNEKDFSNYVGDVINRLKKEVRIDVVSIAPSHETHKHYKELYLACTDDINWVNYQFYMQPIPSKNDFLNLFLNLAKEYDSNKLLVGGSSDPSDANNFKREVFIEGCKELVKKRLIRGIFIWNANDSATEVPPFSLEKKAQEILTKKD
ncbi:putative chitinase [Medicago truncatula]|uniref:Glycoside hydrolase family 18 protein n=1 Tax=Medicago truncatula TaxID=3880 RepID=A0A072TKE7_MEDTR|nr:chitinase 2 [Medicago truncatula]KEH17681.1 glycoside hydrolase family 18 protein [Medicago truncatula]RHN40043.1 putative chitinase [Medicago truncatula]